MKFKVFISTLILFLIIFYTSLFLISYYVFQKETDNLKQYALNEHYFITSTFTKDLNIKKNNKQNLEQSIKLLFDYYKKNFPKQLYILEVVKDHRVLFHNSYEKVSIKKDIVNIKKNKRYVSLEKIENKIYVQVYGVINGFEDYYIRYFVDISKQMEEFYHLQRILLMIGVISAIIVVVFLQILLSKVFQPLHMVSSASKQIANGEYNKKIASKGNDEVSVMAQNFNYMAEKINQHMNELAEQAKSKQQFIDNFSHEIRTPLTSIYGYAEYLQKVSVSEEEKQEAATYIMQESHHIIDIGERLLELATIRNTKVKMHEIAIKDLFCSVKNSLRNKLKEKNILLHYNIEVEKIIGNTELLKSLLINLINNGIRACKVDGCIHLNIVNNEKEVILSITDNGIGIENEYIDKIEEPFYRIDKARNRKDGGVGLGLSICKQIAEIHNAKLKIESKPLEGTTIYIVFK